MRVGASSTSLFRSGVSLVSTCWIRRIWRSRTREIDPGAGAQGSARKNQRVWRTPLLATGPLLRMAIGFSDGKTLCGRVSAESPPGGVIHVSVQSDQYLHGYNREIGDRTELLPPDTCEDAMGAPSLEPGFLFCVAGGSREEKGGENRALYIQTPDQPLLRHHINLD